MKYLEDFIEWPDLEIEEKHFCYIRAIKLLQYEKKIPAEFSVHNILHQNSEDDIPVVLRINSKNGTGIPSYTKSVLQFTNEQYFEVASDSKWADEKISSFKEFFDIRDTEQQRVVRRPSIKDVVLSEYSAMIVETAKYLHEFWYIVENCRDLVSQYDVVITKYGPTILTEDDPVIKRRISKALQCFLDNTSKSAGSEYVQSKMIESFKYIDNEPTFEEYLKKDR